ncbi:M20 metallopeptidase family protein [Brevibacillus sp. NRS-1366]|uniref:M20 metallopeptidase family protein n=1 Tax=Brevibacillus sp. NRS-1366 TaxID=3233899 RepID=UPI003D25DB19
MHTIVSQDLADWAIAHRRHLHQYPELSGQEFETCSYIRNCLEELNIEVLDFCPPNIVGYLKGTEGAKTIAVRADIDALPIMEQGEKSYQSKIPGVAHMCGHDGHTAILLAVAKWLSEHREACRHNILFLFQSSEEALPSGAQALVQEGAIEEADVVFGLHLMQSLPLGKIGVCEGAIMSAADDFTIHIEGKGGHGSMPQDTVDPTYIASHIIFALQSIVSRRLDPLEPAVISVGKLEAGAAYNVIPHEATIGGTIRTLSHKTRALIVDEMTRLVQGICSSYLAKGSVEFGWGAPPVINDKKLAQYAEQVIASGFGQEMLLPIGPMMGSEDFSYYLEKKPGIYLFVGMGGEKSMYPHHHPQFDIDEEAIPTAIRLFLELIQHFES